MKREEEVKIETCAKTSFSVITGNISKKSAGNLRKHWLNPQDMRIFEKTCKWDNIDMTPREIHKELDRYVIGQDNAKKILSVSIYNHNKRLHDNSNLIKKSKELLQN